MDLRSPAARAVNPAAAAVKTWRYLRLAMVMLVVGLGAAVLLEVDAADGCWESSISAYYYTPVQSFFVGTLLAVGVALIALKGNTKPEDVLLNLAGVCAPIVALVPTPNVATCRPAQVATSDSPVAPAEPDENISNNVSALLIAGAIALALLALLSLIGWLRRSTSGRVVERPSAIDMVGFALIVLLWGAATAAFFGDRDWFVEWGHPAAAIAMFFFIWVNVGVNAVNSRRSQEVPAKLRPILFTAYSAIAVLMAVAFAGSLYLGKARDWDDWVLGAEAGLIILFAVYWAIQTAELWNKGLREEPPNTDPERGPTDPSTSQATESPSPDGQPIAAYTAST